MRRIGNIIGWSIVVAMFAYLALDDSIYTVAESNCF